MKNLISMTDFIENLRNEMIPKGELSFDKTKKYFDKVFNYSDFLKQPLELWMFVPCDEDGSVLEEPDKYEDWFRKTYDNGWWNNFVKYKKEYQQAKERCLFEGFEINYFDLGGAEITTKSSFEIINKDNVQICIYKSKPNYFIWNNKNGKENPTIEDLVKYNPQLTQTAIKQLGL